MQNIYLCDIDGTLTHNNGHRSFYDETKVFDDTPLPTVEVIKKIINGKSMIIYLSDRKEGCREQTINWIQKHVTNDYPLLYMRKQNDNRHDEIFKEEVYNTHIKDHYNVLGVFDDRLKVCRMWYKLGLFVFNCNQGLKEF